MSKIMIALAGVGVAAVAILAVMYTAGTEGESPAAPSVLDTNEVMSTDGLRHIVPLEKIRSGGPPMDGIPSIDEPRFVDAADAFHISDDDVVVGLEINGDARAYPLFILVWHEIVNDVVGGTPVSVTYCPLCYTSQVFERTLEGQTVEFGTSGKLYNSNLVMYDRLTRSYWSQALGLAITGELTGQTLKTIPFDVIEWGDWQKLHPDSLALTTDTGHERPYATDPYGDYYTDGQIFFPVENADDRLHPKEIILGLYEDDTYKVYTQRDINEGTPINDMVGGTPVLILSSFSGNSRAFERTLDDMTLDFTFDGNTLVDVQTRSEWGYDGTAISGEYEGTSLARLSTSPGFWFEWVAFHPDTEVYGG